jgi:hypothetical protein
MFKNFNRVLLPSQTENPIGIPQTSAASVLPLAKGKGWGEEEGIVHQSTIHEAARHTHQPTVHGKSKAAWGCRTPRRWRDCMRAAHSARSWSAAAPAFSACVGFSRAEVLHFQGEPNRYGNSPRL